MIRTLAVLLLLAGCASATQESQSCAAPEWEFPNYRTQLETASPGLKWTELNNVERTKVLSAINSSPPQTGYAYDRMGYFSRESHGMVLIVFMLGDCVWESKMATMRMLRAMLGPGEDT